MSEKFPYNLYQWFSSNSEREFDYQSILTVDYGIKFPNGSLHSGYLIPGYFEAHSRILAVIDNDWPNEFAWVWGVNHAELPEQLRTAQWNITEGVDIALPSYLIYESQKVSLFALEVPC